MPSSIVCFSRTTLILSLGDNSNLKRWNIRDSANCELCHKLQTQLHVFFQLQGSPRTTALYLAAWLDSVDYYIIRHLNVEIGADLRLFADCPYSGTTCTSTLFRTLRPDIVVNFKGSVYVVELTVPYETNCGKAKRRQKERYRHQRSELITTCLAFEVISLEVTTLGFCVERYWHIS
jgi:hypothetical protein